jgi:signal transduction histidine kinase/ActR/RegA family two-component response regulator
LLDTFGLGAILFDEEPYQRVHAEDFQRVLEWVTRITAGERVGAVDFRYIMPDGQQRWLSCRAWRRCGADGQATHLYGVTLDLTEQILAVRAAAEEADRIKDEFVAMLSHELRTPLTPARTLAQMLEHDETLAPEHRAAAAEIGMHIGTETRLINDLLDFERVVHEGVQLQLTSVDVHEQVRHALGICAPLVRRKRLVVEEELTAAHPVVHGDVLRLRQVLWNLVQNAARFTPFDGHIRVRSANPRPGVLVLEVEDDGLGIKPDMLEKICAGFERGGHKPDSVGGVGLGLAIGRRIAEAHGGTLTAASPGLGNGAIFTLRLPAEADAEAAAEPPEAPATEPPDADRPLKILLVEDHRPTAKAIARLLRSHGHTVQVVEGHATAEHAVAGERFDLLLCDIQLPDGSGVDLLPRVRHHLRRWAAGGAEAPAIVLSGFARDSDVARSLAAGYVEHLAKPVDQAVLFAAIRRATARTSEIA